MTYCHIQKRPIYSVRATICVRLFHPGGGCYSQIQIQFYGPEGKNQKAKQTIMHCTTKQYNTRQEMKCNAMQ